MLKEVPVVSLPVLADIKKTNREKDYAVIGELARRINDPRGQLLFSRSSRDIIRLAAEHPGSLTEAVARRPILKKVAEGRDALDDALDRERKKG